VRSQCRTPAVAKKIDSAVLFVSLPDLVAYPIDKIGVQARHYIARLTQVVSGLYNRRLFFDHRASFHE
jgi:hypothetical protein